MVLREEVEQLTASPKSIMPDGFEKAMQPQEMTDLLEFLVTEASTCRWTWAR